LPKYVANGGRYAWIRPDYGHPSLLAAKDL
jgi:hypothetical protein